MELIVPQDGTGSSMAWNYCSHGILKREIGQEKRKKVTRSDQFQGVLSFVNSHVFS